MPARSVFHTVHLQINNTIPGYLHFSSRVFRKPPCKMVSTMSHKVIPHFNERSCHGCFPWRLKIGRLFGQIVEKFYMSDHNKLNYTSSYTSINLEISLTNHCTKIFWLLRKYLRLLRNKTIPEFCHHVVSHNSLRYFSNVSCDWL